MKIKLSAILLMLLFLVGCTPSKEIAETTNTPAPTKETTTSETESNVASAMQTDKTETVEAETFSNKSLPEILEFLPLDRCELAMYAVIAPEYHGVRTNYDYFAEAENKLLFAWEMARQDPEIDVEPLSSTPEGYAGGSAIAIDSFCAYYQELFGEEAALTVPDGYDTAYCSFRPEDGKLCAYYKGSLQNAPPLLRKPELQYDDATGAQMLCLDLVVKPELREVDGRSFYELVGEHWQYEDTDYPEDMVFGTLVLQLTQSDDGCQLHSAVVTQG